MKVLFVSNLFPDSQEAIRGLDNAVLLTKLLEGGYASEIRAIGVRPVLWPGCVPDRRRNRHRQPRPEEACFRPHYVEAPYLPKIGSRWNARLMSKALHEPITKALEEFDCDMILASWLFPDGWAVADVALKVGKPVTLICQGSDAHRYLHSPVRKRFIIEACSRSHTVIARSRKLAEMLVANGAPEEKVHAVYNGVDTDLFCPGPQTEAREQLGVATVGPLFLFVGNLLPVKNPMLLLRAWKLFCAEWAGAGTPLMAMAGDGPLRAQVESFARANGLQDNLLLTGRIPPPLIARWMRASDVLCLSSHNEGLPNVILEAFASGLPVVSTDVGGISEVLVHPWLGELTPPGEVDDFAAAMARQIATAGLHKERIAQWGRGYSWGRSCEAYLRIFLA